MKEIIKYIKSDYYRYKGGNAKAISLFKVIQYLVFGRNHGFKYSFWLRLSHKKNIFWPLAIFMHKRMSTKYCMQISHRCQIGYGLYLGHGICMVVNHKTIIGNNVNLSQFLNIGTNKETPATIGNNVWIGPNVCIVEDVKIGNNACVGAGSVVVKDVPENSTVAGAPAKVISYKTHQFIQNPWPMH